MARSTTSKTRLARRRAAVRSFAFITLVLTAWCELGAPGVATVAASNTPDGVATAPSSAPALPAHDAAVALGLAADSLAPSPHVALGVPTDADPSDEVLLDQRAYVVSYNPKRQGPNWVAWHLDRSDLGSTHRRNDFRADATLPFTLYRVDPRDYAHSGYERGHMCPSGDRTRDVEQNSSTFLMTNMLPQVHGLNDGPWKDLEEHERTLANEPDTALYIVAGGIFADTQPVIGHGVSVPIANFKIIAVLHSAQTAADVTAETSVIAAVMPNDASASAHAWSDFLTSVDVIEKMTGYDFLSRVPALTQREIEAKVSRGRDDRRRRPRKADKPRRIFLPSHHEL